MSSINRNGGETLKTFEDLLQEFRQKIKEGYERSGMDRVLARSSSQVDKPVRSLPKFDEPIIFHSVSPEGELPPPIAFKLRKV